MKRQERKQALQTCVLELYFSAQYRFFEINVFKKAIKK